MSAYEDSSLLDYANRVDPAAYGAYTYTVIRAENCVAPETAPSPVYEVDDA